MALRRRRGSTRSPEPDWIGFSAFRKSFELGLVAMPATALFLPRATVGNKGRTGPVSQRERLLWVELRGWIAAARQRRVSAPLVRSDVFRRRPSFSSHSSRSASSAGTGLHAPLRTASVFNRRERTPLTSNPVSTRAWTHKRVANRPRFGSLNHAYLGVGNAEL